MCGSGCYKMPFKKTAPPPTNTSLQPETTIGERLDITYLLLRQIQMVAQASLEGDEARFQNSIETLLSLLPNENIAKVEAQKKDYVKTTEEPQFKTFCGKQLGTIDQPLMRNSPQDWNYNPNLPQILVSPIMVETEQTDYQILLRIILKELEKLQITYRREHRETVGKKINYPPTPLIKLRDGSFIKVLIQKGVSEIPLEAVVESDREAEPIEEVEPDIESDVISSDEVSDTDV